MTWKTDEEVAALFNSFSEKERTRVAITRWRNKSRHPKYEERIEIENRLGVPFEVFHKDVDFDALIAKGHSVIVIEHNIELIKCADYIIDLGPEGGDNGGELLAEGTPEDIVKSKKSFTAGYLKEKL